MFGGSVWLVASCNGLLLCNATSEGRWSRRTIYYICNPVTKQWVLRPTPPPLTLDNKTHVVDERAGFICDCDNQFHNPGYKVVLFPQYQGMLLMSPVKIFSFCSESGNWSEFDVELPQGLSWGQHFSDIVSYNGMFYGLFSHGIFAYDSYDKPDELSLIDLPKDMDGEYIMHASIGVIQGKIRVCHLTEGRSDISLYLWELQDYSNGTWCKPHHQVSVTDTVSEFSSNIRLKEGFGTLSVKCFSESDGDIVYIFDNSSIFLCNLKAKTLESLCHLPPSQGVINNALPIGLPSWPALVPNFKAKA